MPSLIGYSSLPLYEAFFFKKPIFYTKDLLEEELKEFVTEIDINNLNSLANEIINFKNKKKNLELKTINARNYFDKHLTNERITESYRNIFKKLINSKKIYL